MKEKVNASVAQILKKLNASLKTCIRNESGGKKEFEGIFSECFTQAFEKAEAEDEGLQNLLYWRLCLKFHPDRFQPNEVFDRAIITYVEEQGFLEFFYSCRNKRL
jgi:hypothetical protein